MNIKIKAEKAVSQLEKLLAENWTKEQEEQARKIIEKAMTNAVHEVCTASEQVINQCCSADQDMAHKLNDEIKLAREALLANLNSLR